MNREWWKHSLLALLMGALGAVMVIGTMAGVKKTFEEKPPAGTLTFILNAAPDGIPVNLHVSSFSIEDGASHTGHDYPIVRDRYPHTEVVSVSSETVNVTITALPTPVAPLEALDCVVLWQPDGGVTERYNQYDEWDDITLPKCDWRRYYPND